MSGDSAAGSSPLRAAASPTLGSMALLLPTRDTERVDAGAKEAFDVVDLEGESEV